MKVVILQVKGIIAPYIMEDYKDAFEKLNHEILLLDLNKFNSDSYEELINFKPDFAISYGMNSIIKDVEGTFLLREANIPTVGLYYDNPLYSINDEYEQEIKKNPSYYHHFVWDQYYVELLQSRGYENVNHIMLATNPNKFHPDNNIMTQEGTLSFVGSVDNLTKRTATNVEEIFVEYIINEKIKNFDIPVYDLCKEAFELDRFEAIKYLQEKYPELFWKKVHFAIHSLGSKRLRGHILNSLEGVDIHTYGLGKGLINNENIIIHPSISYKNLSQVYQKYAVNLNISSLQLETSVNNRIFDVFASKSFVISDYKEDMKKVAPDMWSEISFNNLEDLLVKADYYLTHPNHRKELIESLYENIIENHTYTNRVAQIVEKIISSQEIFHQKIMLDYPDNKYKEKLENCPICQEDNSSLLHSINGHENFETHLYRCQNCSTVFMNPQPTENYLDWFYNNVYYSKQHREKMGWDPNLSNVNISVFRINEIRMDLVEEYCNQTRYPRGHLLDVGCSSGNFIWEAQLRYWSVQGLEISEDAAEQGRQSRNLNIITGELDENIFPEESFDVVTAWDVLEHIPKPNEFMENINKVLKEDGLFVGNTPNVSSSISYYSGSEWRHLDPPLHVVLYDHISLRILLKKHNFEILKISSGEEYLGQLQFVAKKQKNHS